MVKVIITDSRNHRSNECKVIHSSTKSFPHVKTDLALIVVEHVPMECLEVIAFDKDSCVEAPRLYVPIHHMGPAGDRDHTDKGDVRRRWAQEIKQQLALVRQLSDGSFEVGLGDGDCGSSVLREVPMGVRPFALRAVEVEEEEGEGGGYADVDIEFGSTVVDDDAYADALVPSTPPLAYMRKRFDVRCAKSVSKRFSWEFDITDQSALPKILSPAERDEDDLLKSAECGNRHHIKSGSSGKMHIEKMFEEYKMLTEQSLFHQKALGEVHVPLEVGPFPLDTHRQPEADVADIANIGRSCSLESISTLSDYGEWTNTNTNSYYGLSSSIMAPLSSFAGKHLTYLGRLGAAASKAIVPRLRWNKIHAV